MNDWQAHTLQDYQRKGLANRSGYGQHPVLLIVDFIYGFTDPQSPLGGDYPDELAATARLLSEFRQQGLPIVFTTVAYEPHFRDAGVFIKKVPSLAVLAKGSRMVEVDERIAPQRDEYVLEKKYPSAFFGTQLDSYLKARRVDTVIIAGCTTSGCIRASAIDAMQYGFHTVVVREAVGDRAAGPHEANLFDIDAKYGDVVSLDEALAYLRHGAGGGDRATDEFRHWWDQQPGVST